MKWKKKWRKVVQTAVLLMLVSVLACPLPVLAETESNVTEESVVTEEKDTNTDVQTPPSNQTENNEEKKPVTVEEKDVDPTPQLPASNQTENNVAGTFSLGKTKTSSNNAKIDALIQALGGSEYAEISGSHDVRLKQSVTIDSGTIIVPDYTTLYVNTDENGNPVTLTLGKSVDFSIESNGYLTIEQGGFLKIDCAISATEGSIWLGEGSSISSLNKLEDGLLVPNLTDGKTVSCTDWKEERTVYAPIDYEIDPEGFIIKEDGRGMAYKTLGWGWNKDSALYESQAGDMIYLLRDFITTDKEDGNTYGINCPLKRDVTLVIKEGQTFNIGLWSLMAMAKSGTTDIPAEGTIIAFAGSQCIMPWSNLFERSPFVGTTDRSLLKLDSGFFRLELPRPDMVSPARLFAAPKAGNKAVGGTPAQAILTANSQGTFCQPLYLRLLNDQMDCIVGENSTLTVKSLLVVDGNQKFNNNPSNLTLDKGSTLQTQGGIVYLDELTKTYLNEGASFSAESIDGDINLKEDRNGFQSYFKGLLSVGPEAGLELQNEKLFGGQDAYMSVKAGTAEVTLDKANLLSLTDGSNVVLNNDWKFGLTSTVAPNNNYLKNLTVGTGSTLTINAALTIPTGSTLNNNGTIIIGPNGKLILEDDNALNNNGQIIVQPGGEIIGANSFKLTPFQDKDFRSEEEGYKNPEILDVAVANNGMSETPPITVTLSGNNADAFSLTPSGTLGSLDAGTEKHFTVAPKEGLKEGTYTADVTVANEDITVASQYVSATFQVSFTVTKASPGGNPDPETPPTDDPSSGKDTPADSSNTKLPNSGGSKRAPMTGDSSPSMGLLTLLMILSLMVGATTVLGYRRKNRR